VEGVLVARIVQVEFDVERGEGEKGGIGRRG